MAQLCLACSVVACALACACILCLHAGCILGGQEVDTSCVMEHLHGNAVCGRGSVAGGGVHKYS